MNASAATLGTNISPVVHVVVVACLRAHAHVILFRLETPFGQLPTLSIDGQVIGQSQAINTYVAEITGTV